MHSKLGGHIFHGINTIHMELYNKHTTQYALLHIINVTSYSLLVLHSPLHPTFRLQFSYPTQVFSKSTSNNKTNNNKKSFKQSHRKRHHPPQPSKRNYHPHDSSPTLPHLPKSDNEDNWRRCI
mmetsp:Transcript_30091/g.63038  ORF Transcript_30091/g.63038 Transcript_30091/m.63038 type:complete len:123 (+) Transcript_30091:82-450(+)